ncbi:MAG: hypothetical protein WC732_06075 [Candidatus Omnitrophota bacterium]
MKTRRDIDEEIALLRRIRDEYGHLIKLRFAESLLKMIIPLKKKAAGAGKEEQADGADLWKIKAAVSAAGILLAMVLFKRAMGRPANKAGE